MADEGPARLVAEHIENGLERYGRGELLAALTEWEHALRLDPSNLRARQYVQYVRENYELLASRFGRTVDAGRAAPGLPALAPELDDDSAGGENPFGGPSQTEALAQLASGWELEDFMPERLPPPPSQPLEPQGIEVPPADEWARSQPGSVDDLAAVAQAVLEPFGVQMTPPHGSEAIQGSGGSLESLGVRPLDADPLASLEPGLDPERTRPPSARVPKTRVPSRPPPVRIAMPLEPEEIAAFEAATVERAVKLESAAAPPAQPPPSERLRPPPERPTVVPGAGARRSFPHPPSESELDFSGLLEEGEDEAKTETRARSLPNIESRPGRKVTRTPAGGLLVEYVAELPDEFLGPDEDGLASEPTSDGVLSSESDDAVSQLDAEAPTLERPQAAVPVDGDALGPPVDDALLGLEPEEAPPAPTASRASFPELEIVMEKAASPRAEPAPPFARSPAPPPVSPAVQEIADDVSPPPHEGPIITLAPPEGSGAWRVLESDLEIVRPGAVAPASIFEEPASARARDQAGPAEPTPAGLEDRITGRAATRRAPVTPPLEPDSRPPRAKPQFSDESTPLPPPYDPEAIEDHAGEARTTKPKGSARLSEPGPAGALAEHVRAHLLEAKKQFERGDLAAAALAAEGAFTCDPAGEAAPVREAERQLLIRIFETQLGSLKRVPAVAMPAAEIACLGLDHRFGFLLDRIDGATSFDDLLDIAGMPRLEAYRILESLLRRGVIGCRS